MQCIPQTNRVAEALRGYLYLETWLASALLWQGLAPSVWLAALAMVTVACCAAPKMAHYKALGLFATRRAVQSSVHVRPHDFFVTGGEGQSLSALRLKGCRTCQTRRSCAYMRCDRVAQAS